MNRSTKLALGGSLLTLMLGVGGCTIDKEESGQLPDVDVQGGNMPEYDVDAPEVDVGTKEKVITVPDVDVTMPDDDEPDVVREPVEPIKQN